MTMMPYFLEAKQTQGKQYYYNFYCKTFQKGKIYINFQYNAQ